MNFRRLFGLAPRSVTSDNVPMDSRFQQLISSVDPIADSIYGPRYRCSLTLKDGAKIPCAILQSKANLIDLAKRRIKEEMSGKGKIAGPDPYGQILSVFVAGGNRISDYEIASVEPSPHAIPLSLLQQIHGETTMGWTGWVFEMTDGRPFAYGSDFSMEFFDLPPGYRFSDVAKVHNHSYVNENGDVRTLERGSMLSATAWSACAEIAGNGESATARQNQTPRVASAVSLPLIPPSTASSLG